MSRKGFVRVDITICFPLCGIRAHGAGKLAGARCAEVQTQLESDETCDPMTRSCQVRTAPEPAADCPSLLHSASSFSQRGSRTSVLLASLYMTGACYDWRLQTVMHVWESTCRPCWGTGSITSSSRGRGRRMSYVCPTCHGLGECDLLAIVLAVVWAMCHEAAEH